MKTVKSVFNEKSNLQIKKENNYVISVVFCLVVIIFLTILTIVGNIYQNIDIDALMYINFS